MYLRKNPFATRKQARQTLFKTLLKRQIIERLSVFRREKKDLDILGAFLTIGLAVCIIGATVFALSRFLRLYCGVSFDGVYDVRARQFEVLSIVYFGIFAIGILSGVKAINGAVFDADDLKLLSVLPISTKSLFFSKLFTVYVKQILNCAITIIPVNMAFAIVTPQSAAYIFMTVLLCMLMPLATLTFSAFFSLPVYWLKKRIESKYALCILLLTAIAGLLYWGYSEILSFIGAVISDGGSAFFFDEATMLKIISVTENLFPGNIFAGILLNIDVWKNWGIFSATVLIGAGISILLIKYLFDTALQSSLLSEEKVNRKRAKKLSPKRSVFTALVYKEWLSVLHTPSYAFGYISTLVTMPLMIFFCMSVGTDMLSGLVFIECNTELALTLMLLFGVLTNTFCATNISREGHAFFVMKTLPFSFKSIVRAKIVFCSAVSVIAVACSSAVLGATGFLGAKDSLFVFVIGVLIGETEICFATRYDFNHPAFLCSEDGCARDNSRALSVVTVSGLLIAVCLGGLSIFVSAYAALQGNESAAGLFTYLFTGLGAILLFCLSVAYLCKNLDKKYSEITEGCV